MGQKPPPNASPFAASSSQTTSQSPFGGGKANVSTPAPAFGTTGMASSPFGQPTSSATPAPSPFSAAAPATAGGVFGTPAPTLGFGAPAPTAASTPTILAGKTPRELLTAFYQEKNPAKVAEVDKLLAKYQGNEAQLFRNLAKKYNLDPSVFGLSGAPSGAGFGASSPGISTSSPGGFGQPSALGGGPTFGGMAQPATPFGVAPTAAASFGSTSTPGQAFGSSAGGFGGPSFGSLAQSPATPGFGSFGSPQAAPATPFSPFGAPRR